ncbi:hypothetical protein H4R18_001000 [Coemansia javaensis]|uniref:Uncharacterized protein n=1 Tax=Coemansia javaensis TaxID=2761396 RepID=A0A9W8HE97_9FUNG|nr:hypothetical protein H4R18_001000 [Coemansia javaensis]
MDPEVGQISETEPEVAAEPEAAAEPTTEELAASVASMLKQPVQKSAPPSQGHLCSGCNAVFDSDEYYYHASRCGGRARSS